MRTFGQKLNQPQQPTSFDLTRSNTAASSANQHTHSLAQTQRTIGHQTVQPLPQAYPGDLELISPASATARFGHDFSRIPIHSNESLKLQTKLMINTPGDAYEQEADRVADQVLRMPEAWSRGACAYGGEPTKCQADQPGQEHMPLQIRRVQADDHGESVAPPIVDQVLRSPGRPLDSATTSFFESRFGHDFSQVRVHTDAQAAAVARAIHARAFTAGRHVVFGVGEYAPATATGRQLLAHELTHVIQQSQSSGETIVRREPASGSSGDTTSPPAITSAEFQEHPSQVYHGFDPTSKPIKALVIPHDNSRKLAVKVEPSGAKPQYVILGPNPISIKENETSNDIEVTGTTGSKPGLPSEIMATDHDGKVLDRIGIWVLPRQEVSVGYHFMSDPPWKLFKNQPPARTKRNPGDAPALTATLNQVWLPQANIHFSTHSALPEEFKTRQIDRVGGSDDLLKKLFSPFSSGADMEVFLVMGLTNIDDPMRDPNGRRVVGTNITILEDADAPDGFDIAHEAGHFLADGQGHTELGLMAPTTAGPDRPRVLSSTATLANSKAGTL